MNSSAQEYYDSLMAQGYTPEQAKGFTQQHFPGFSPTAPIVILPQTLMPQMGVETGVPLGGTMSKSIVKLGCIRSNFSSNYHGIHCNVHKFMDDW